MLKRIGTGGDDTLVATAGMRTLLSGGDGNDTLTGSTDTDVLDGGAGNDRLDGGDGDDIALGGDGDDSLYSSVGNDYLDGGAGNDFIQISHGYIGSNPVGGTVFAYGGAGDDRFYISNSGGAAATIDAGDGNDLVEVAFLQGSSLTVTLGAGSDVLLLDSVDFQNPITVTDFQAGNGGDQIQWDFLFAGLNATKLTGNPFGQGWASLSQSGANVILSVDSDGPTASATMKPALILQNVTLVALTAWNFGGDAPDGSAPVGSSFTVPAGGALALGTAGADTITGTAGRDQILGGMGNDTIAGGDGNDLLYGGMGTNSLDGGLGDDTLIDGPGSDTLIGGDGDDTLQTSYGGSDTLDGGNGNDRLYVWANSGDSTIANGGAGSDQVRIVAASVGSNVTVDLGADDDRLLLSSLSGTVTATLGTGADTVTYLGSVSGLLTITDFQTGAGGDVLDLMGLLVPKLGWNGSGNIFGSQVRLLQSGADTLLQTASTSNGVTVWKTLIDLQNTTAASFTTYNLDGLPPDGSPGPGIVVTGSPSVGIIKGSIGPDSITGDAKAENIAGYGGDDVIHGGDGNDTIDGGLGTDAVFGDGGDDILSVAATGGADTVHGGDGNDKITSSGMGAHLFGDAGNDTIADLGGAAELDGGDGDDTLSLQLAGGTPSVAVRGGAGDDYINLSAPTAPTLNVDAGDGNDIVFVSSHGATNLTLGAGHDIVRIGTLWLAAPAPSIVVTDFTAGAGGDLLDVPTLLAFNYSYAGWSGTSDPFAAGYVRLVQSGADTLLQMDADGPGTSMGFVTVATLQNVLASSLTPENLGVGTNAADTFRIAPMHGGAWYGLGGDDVFYFGGGFTADSSAQGGSGADTVILQGDYSNGLLLGAASLAGVESLVLLGHADTSWGGGGASPFNYVLQLADYATAETPLLVDAHALGAGETLTFDAANESAAAFHVLGSGGADEIVTGAADDIIDGGAGADVMAGGDGDDVYYVDDAGDQVVEAAGDGTDEVRTALAAYVLPDNVENLTGLSATGQTLTGNGLDNRIQGGGGNDTLAGGGGNDVLSVTFPVFGSVAATVDGGSGFDRLVVTLGAGAAGLQMSTTANPDGSYSGWIVDVNGSRVDFSGIEAFGWVGSDGPDRLVGSGGDDQLYGRGGDDTLTGYAGNDLLDGGTGVDTMIGGLGNDHYVVDSAADAVVEAAGEGIDSVDSTAASYTLPDNVEVLTGLLATGQILTGNGLANTITGGDGNDVIDGGTGADVMNGGNGNDVYYVDNAGDVVQEGPFGGVDEIRTSLASYTLDSTLENLTGTSNSGQTLKGNNGDNVIKGGAGDDVIDGGPGVDTMSGGAGNDTYYVSMVTDQVIEKPGEGTDTVIVSFIDYTAPANVENLTAGAFGQVTLRGNALDNVLTGASNTVFYIGTGGNDSVIGNSTTDFLTVDWSDSSQPIQLQLTPNATLGGWDGFASHGTDGSLAITAINQITFTGGSGIDGIAADFTSYTSAFSGLTETLGPSGTWRNFDYFVDLKTGSTDDVVSTTALALDDKISTGAGNDRISVYNGNDIVDGGTGYDTLTVDWTGLSGDVVWAVPLTANAAGGWDGKLAGPGYSVSFTGIEVFNITTGSGNDVLAGGAAGDMLVGGAGADTIDGGAGDDFLFSGTAPAGSLRTNPLAQSLDTLADHDVLRGGDGNDFIFAGYGDDVDGGSQTYGGGDALAISFMGATSGVTADFRLLATQSSITIGGGTITGVEEVDAIEGTNFDDFLAAYSGGSGAAHGGNIYGRGGNDHIIASYYSGASFDAIYGGDGDDVLDGSPSQYGAALYGEAGNDTLIGSYNGQTMAGGTGDDLYFVNGDFNSVIENAGEGTDEVRSSIASYTLTANVENLRGVGNFSQTLNGNALDNKITGGSFNDTVTGGDGNDLLDGGVGADTMAGGAGNDVYYVDNAGDVVTENAGEGYDEVRTTLATYVLPANVEKLTYVGTGNFTYTGGGGNDDVAGAGGNDFFDLSQGGADKASGGAGTDAFAFGAAFGAGDVVDGGAGFDTVGLQGDYTGANRVTIGAGQLVNVETLNLMRGTGTPSAYDVVWQDGNLASGQRMTIYAGNLAPGENVSFDGSAETHGYFIIFGGQGADDLKGGSGSDGFYFGPGKFSQADRIDGGGGTVNQIGLDGSYDFEAGSALGTLGGNFTNVQTIVLYKGDPADPSNPYPNHYHIVTNEAAAAAGQTLTIYGVLVASDLVFDGSAEHDGAFRILSGSGNDTLTGGAGNDLLYGNAGADTLAGGAGNDTFVYVDAADSAGAAVDHILDFDAGDRIDLSQIDADTTQAGDQAFAFIGAAAFGHHAGELRASFDQANNLWTIEADTNGDGQADLTLLVTTQNSHAIVQGDFIA